MLTGDNEKTAKAIAKQLGIEKVIAKCITKTKSRRNQKAKNKMVSHDVWRWHK